MAEQLQPESVANVLADFDRRLRNLEATARVGLSETIFDEPSGGTTITTYDDWQLLLAPGITWTPRTTTALIFVSAAIQDTGTSGTFRASEVRIGVQWTAPLGGFTFDVTELRATEATQPPTYVSGFFELFGLTPGVPSTVRMAAWATSKQPTGTNPFIGPQRMLLIPR